MNGKCAMQYDRYAREERPAPYGAGARIALRQEAGGEADLPGTPSTPLRPPLRPCPPRPGCDCAPPTRPECGFQPGSDCTSRSTGSTTADPRSGRRARTDRRRTGCGGNGNDTSLLEELRAVEFALDEVILYLDAYPCDRAALDFYHHLLERRAPLMEQYQAEVGPLTPLGNTSHTSWDWVRLPFPWEYDADR